MYRVNWPCDQTNVYKIFNYKVIQCKIRGQVS